MNYEREHKVISFNGFIYCIEKRLGIDGVEATRIVYEFLDKKHPRALFTRNILLDDAIELKKQFLAQVDGKLSDIQMDSFEKEFSKTIKDGADNFSEYRINPNRYDTGCKTVVIGSKKHGLHIVSNN
jgi:hypothetical protein